MSLHILNAMDISNFGFDSRFEEGGSLFLTPFPSLMSLCVLNPMEISNFGFPLFSGRGLVFPNLIPLINVVIFPQVGRYLRELGMPPLTVQEEGLTKGASCLSHWPRSGAS